MFDIRDALREASFSRPCFGGKGRGGSCFLKEAIGYEDEGGEGVGVGEEVRGRRLVGFAERSWRCRRWL